jgi:hypothetical protein
MFVLGHTPCRSGSPHGVFGCFQAVDTDAVFVAVCPETVPTVAANPINAIKRYRYLNGISFVTFRSACRAGRKAVLQPMKAKLLSPIKSAYRLLRPSPLRVNPYRAGDGSVGILASVPWASNDQFGSVRTTPINTKSIRLRCLGRS